MAEAEEGVGEDGGRVQDGIEGLGGDLRGLVVEGGDESGVALGAEGDEDAASYDG